ncbi:hypothetical protein CHS0354_026750 [Potamilus streckersoni]|uniref:GDP-fucose pyrophosphorylase domain-containing protein n=1 Tax=Potamilus streckersoni TaxID=2493646 RepID=A0AAE0RMS0_9BIVA|nr:hypothetical protein CHS0354_026750 [Potamilus streckersoni]
MEGDLNENNIVKFMNQLLKRYDDLRGKDKSRLDGPFWDVVVITAADEDQKDVYVKQIEQKLSRKELPLGVPYFVISDPPGPKLGNGGSTFTAVSVLEEKYGSHLFDLRVLLIHAGGQSQRLPSVSVLGKIFSPVPFGQPLYQMLDVKLAMYLPLIAKLGPGIFVTCADDFLVCNLGQNGPNTTFSTTGFTALAHPSTLAIGTGHGVYVVKELENIDTKALVLNCECIQVLQKPSEEMMYKKGAVLKGKDLHFPDGIKIFGSAAYTDSSFYFAHDITKKFIKFAKDNGALTCEIDAYGDFLQALGPLASEDYIYNTSNVSTITPDLIPTRQKIFSLLNGSSLMLIVMNSSKFIHIGTMKEYIDSYCSDVTFQAEMHLSKDIFNLWTTYSNGDLEDCEAPRKRIRLSDTCLGCVMHSILPQNSFTSSRSVLEYCHFDTPVQVGQNTILSNCRLLSTEKCMNGQGEKATSSSVKVSDNLFLHTIPVTVEDKTQFVTIFCDIEDNLKKVAVNNDIAKLHFLQKTVEDVATILDIDLKETAPHPSIPGSKINLWFSSLFPVVDTMSQSLMLSLKAIKAIREEKAGMVSFKEYPLYSMARVLQTKDLMSMLAYREELFKQISSSNAKC